MTTKRRSIRDDFDLDDDEPTPEPWSGKAIDAAPAPAEHRFRPCADCGQAPDVHNTNRGRDFVGHEYR